MRKRSGSVDSSDPLVGFIYILARDHLTPGVIERIMENQVEPSRGQDVQFTNGYLARYSEDVAERLKEVDPMVSFT